MSTPFAPVRLFCMCICGVLAFPLLGQIQTGKNHILCQGRTRSGHVGEEPTELTTPCLKGLGITKPNQNNKLR